MITSVVMLWVGALHNHNAILHTGKGRGGLRGAHGGVSYRNAATRRRLCGPLWRSRWMPFSKTRWAVVLCSCSVVLCLAAVRRPRSRPARRPRPSPTDGPSRVSTSSQPVTYLMVLMLLVLLVMRVMAGGDTDIELSSCADTNMESSSCVDPSGPGASSLSSSSVDPRFFRLAANRLTTGG